MRTLSLIFTAGEMKSLSIPGRYFRILSSGLNSVDVEFFKNNSVVGEKATAVDAGYYGIPEHGFDRVDVTSSTTQTVKVALGSGAGGYDRTVGTVDINNVNSAWVNAQKTVTNASAQMLAANAARRALIMQNNDAVGSIWVRFDGTAATTATGIRLKPGESVSLNGFAPTGAIMAIGDIASNANVVAVEG